MGDFLAFRRMLLPLLLQLFFWLGVLACIGAGVYLLLADDPTLKPLFATNAPWLGSAWVDWILQFRVNLAVALIVGGPFVLRLHFELLLLPFRINSTLTEIRKILLAQNNKTPAPPATSHPVPLDPGPVRVRR